VRSVIIELISDPLNTRVDFFFSMTPEVFAATVGFGDLDTDIVESARQLIEDMFAPPPPPQEEEEEEDVIGAYSLWPTASFSSPDFSEVLGPCMPPESPEAPSSITSPPFSLPIH
jgi:hypothetical protein